MRRRGRGLTFVWILIVLAGIFLYRRDRQRVEQEGAEAVSSIDNALMPEAPAPERDGLAAAILIDVSGSMDETPDGGGVKKIVSAKRAAIDLVDQFARYAADHPNEPVMLGIYEFSERSGQADAREVVPMGAPNRGTAAAAIDRMDADGGTPIGAAMVIGKLALDRTGLSRRHLLVVTDGENTEDPDPAAVAAAIRRRPPIEQPSIYFVAFDIDANRFDGVKEQGGLVLEAANSAALNETLDSLLRGKILVEQ